MQSEKGKLGGRPKKATDKPEESRRKATVKLKGKPEESPPSPPSSPSSDSDSETAAAAKPPRVYEREPVIDAIARCECSDLGQVTGVAWGRYAQVRKELSARWPDKATLPAEIARR